MIGGIDNSVASSYVDTLRAPVNVNTDNDKKLKEQTDKFEAFFIKKVLDVSMKKDVSLFGKDAGDNIYHSMYNGALSDAMSGKFGLSQLLFNFLKERG